MSSSIKEVKIGFLRGVVILRRWINLFPSAEMIIKAKSYFATAFFMTRIPVFITNKKNHSKEWFFLLVARGGFLKFVLYHLLRCAAASRKLTKLHRSQQKAPQELFYRLAPSPVRIPVFITNKKPLRRVVFYW